MPLVMALGFGCGVEPEVLLPLPNDEDRATTCTYCDTVTDEPDVPIAWPDLMAELVANPSQVMFYGGIDSPAVIEPRTVTVTNNTTSTVLVTRVFIVDAATLTTEGADAQYFSVAQANLDEPLSAGGTLDLSVSFTVSTEQRGAFLVIETTHPGTKSMVVSLAGKIFLGW